MTPTKNPTNLNGQGCQRNIYMILKITFVIIVFISSHLGTHFLSTNVSQTDSDQQCSDLMLKLQPTESFRNVPVNITEKEFSERDLKVMELMNKKMRGWFE